MSVYASIIIPIYNCEKYLEQCLSSVMHQTFRDFEVILIDDGSTDGSNLIYKKFVEQDKRFSAYFQENEGVSAARNKGLDMVQGEIIVFLDSDDVIFDRFLEVMVDFFKKGYDLVCFASRKLENNISQTAPSDIIFEELTAWQMIEELLYHRKQLCITRSVYRKNKYRDLRFQAGLFICEDILMLLEILVSYKSTIPFISTPLYGYRIRRDSLTHYGNWKRKLSGIDAMDMIENILTGHEINMEKALINRRMNSMRLIYKTIPWDEKEIRNRVWKTIRKYRKTVIFDKQSQTKERLAALVSLGGQRVYRLFLLVVESLK